MVTRSDAIRVARTYLDTPFHHAERKPGIGMDCAGLVICVMRELGLCLPVFDVEQYDARPDGVSMLAQCDKYMTRIARNSMQPGDVIVLITDKFPQHIGLVGDYAHGGLSIIHAANNATPPRVIETRLMFSRTCRLVAVYSLPGIE